MFSITYKHPVTGKFNSHAYGYLEEASEFIAYLMDTLNVSYYTLTYIKVD